MKVLFNVMTYYRIANRLTKTKFKFISQIIGKLMKFFFACEIAYTAEIHKSVFFPHNGLGVVIGHDAKIGKGTKILQNVTIGGRAGIRANPVIGENVLIGAGACILGNVKIGNNAKIGANAVVLIDVPDNCVAVGIPAKIVSPKS